ncbi:glycosyl hydrolase family 18 protein [Paenibacillus sp. FJAT-26967]|uniref:glycosyl hydrolase family 18 protein n=1 Tax=Paenibacillus sp. FJAT-26967 TaxID=1729690 RepID=UPI000837B7DD|nr:glycosyl hydrolase family 18 protein [Paenibacillus sp. FJAT-26967]
MIRQAFLSGKPVIVRILLALMLCISLLPTGTSHAAGQAPAHSPEVIFRVDATDSTAAQAAEKTANFKAGANTLAAACAPAEWNASTAYTGGQRVTYLSKVYEAKWWTQGDRPDLSGTWGVWKTVSDCTGGGTDTTAPTVPANLSAGAAAATSVALSWQPSTDNVAVTGYEVYNGAVLAVSTAGTSTTVTGLTPNTTYTFTVKAKDAAGNLSAASAALTVKTSAGGDGGGSNPPSGIIGAYVAAWNFPNVSTVPAHKLTHAFYAFADVAGNGVSGGNASHIAQLVTLKQKNPALKVLISVGGWGRSQGFVSASSTEANRTAFANSALQYIRTHKLDGIDLDWEYPAAGDKQNYTLLLKKLREVLDAGSAADGRTGAARYQITAAMGASEYSLQGIDLAAVHPYFDFINIMTYDMQINSNSHHANLYTSPLNPSYSVHNSVQLYKGRGVPANKIVIGGAFYSRGLGEYKYDDLKNNYINKNGWVRQWDDTAKAPYLTKGSSFLGYDDTESLTHKVNYLKNGGLGGIMFWDYGQNLDGELLQAIYSTMN